jgi:DNA-binding transcriptional ArsR family regulator
MVAAPARSRMLANQLSGEIDSPTELAKAASVTPATASGHLNQLLEARFVVCEPRGRHRYYRLADADVAHALEALAVVAERGEHDSEWSSPERARLRYARCCYGHLAGRLGIRLFDGLMAVDGLQPVSAGYTLTDSGRAWLQRLGFEAPAPSTRRRFAYPCLDWSERRDHLAGQLADQLYLHLVAQGWLRRGAGRDVAVTPLGHQSLIPLLGREG